MKPSVSIITPMYNAEAFISDTIKSVIDQTYKHWELLLVDDASSDKTLEKVRPFVERHPNIKLLINKTNQGTAVSRNKGLLEAQGKYMSFLDADDLWKPQKLQTQLTFMQDQDCDICFSSYELIDYSGKSLKKQVTALARLSYNKLLKCNYIGNLTGIYNAEVLGKITVPDLRKRQDWLQWLMALKKSAKPALGIQQSLAYYRVHDASMSSNKWGLVKYNFWIFKKGLGFSTIKSIWYFVVFLVEYFFVRPRQIKSTKSL